MPQQNHTFDKNLLLKDAGLIASSAAALVGGAAKVLDLGANSRSNVWVRADVSALEIDTGNEVYGIELQFSSSPTFASDIVVGAVLRLGHSSVAFGSASDTPGTYEFGAPNEFKGVLRQYARLFHRIAGTIATGINYTAFATVNPGA